MSAREDYPYAGGHEAMCAEIDRLRAEVDDFKLRWKHACARADRLEKQAGRP